MIYKTQRNCICQIQPNEFQSINYEFQTIIHYKAMNKERFYHFLQHQSSNKLHNHMKFLLTGELLIIKNPCKLGIYRDCTFVY